MLYPYAKNIHFFLRSEALSIIIEINAVYMEDPGLGGVMDLDK